jgi:hypothetical protein
MGRRHGRTIRASGLDDRKPVIFEGAYYTSQWYLWKLRGNSISYDAFRSRLKRSGNNFAYALNLTLMRLSN